MAEWISIDSVTSSLENNLVSMRITTSRSTDILNGGVTWIRIYWEGGGNGRQSYDLTGLNQDVLTITGCPFDTPYDLEVRYYSSTGTLLATDTAFHRTMNMPVISSSYPTTYIPAYIPTLIKDQATVGNCVACSIANMMEMFLNKSYGMENIPLSCSWIYGNRKSGNDFTEDNQYNNEALDNLKVDGVPFMRSMAENILDFIDVTDNSYYDFNWYTGFDNRRIYTGYLNGRENLLGAYNLVQRYIGNSAFMTQARRHKISSWNAIQYPVTAAQVETIKGYIYNHGAALVNLGIPYAMYDISSDGIMPEVSEDDWTAGADNKWDAEGHNFCIIGWKYINSKPYWICINSWGAYWGDEGITYVPFHWQGFRWYLYATPSLSAEPNTYWANSGKVNGVVQSGNYKVSGNEFYLTASEWNAVKENIKWWGIFKSPHYDSYNGYTEKYAHQYDPAYHSGATYPSSYYSKNVRGTNITIPFWHSNVITGSDVTKDRYNSLLAMLQEVCSNDNIDDDDYALQYEEITATKINWLVTRLNELY